MPTTPLPRLLCLNSLFSLFLPHQGLLLVSVALKYHTPLLSPLRPASLYYSILSKLEMGSSLQNARPPIHLGTFPGIILLVGSVQPLQPDVLNPLNYLLSLQ